MKKIVVILSVLAVIGLIILIVCAGNASRRYIKAAAEAGSVSPAIQKYLDEHAGTKPTPRVDPAAPPRVAT